MKQFIARESFWELFPQACFGILIIDYPGANNLNLTEEQKRSLADTLKKANVDALKHLDREPFSSNEVVAVWREAYKKFKTKRGARSAIENLLKRSFKGNPVESIDPVVDIGNIISLRYGFAAGGEDVKTLVGDMQLKITEGGDHFIPIGSTENDPTLPGELAYLDDAGAVVRSWTWRDGVRTAITPDTTRAFLIVECVDRIRMGDVVKALDELESLCVSYLGAKVLNKDIVCKERPQTCIEE